MTSGSAGGRRGSAAIPRWPAQSPLRRQHRLQDIKGAFWVSGHPAQRGAQVPSQRDVALTQLGACCRVFGSVGAICPLSIAMTGHTKGF